MTLAEAIQEAKDLVQCMELPTPDQIKAIEKLVELGETFVKMQNTGCPKIPNDCANDIKSQRLYNEMLLWIYRGVSVEALCKVMGERIKQPPEVLMPVAQAIRDEIIGE